MGILDCHGLRLWTAEPNCVVPPILRADVHFDLFLLTPPSEYLVSVSARPDIVDSINTSSHSDNETPLLKHSGISSALSEEEAGYCIRAIRRTLVPRQKRDTPQVQDIFYFRTVTECRVLHIAVFGEGIEESPVNLPFYYPKVLKFEYTKEDSAKISINIKRFSSQYLELISEPPSRTEYIWTRLLKTLIKFAIGSEAGYTKRVQHDLLVEKVQFQDTYSILKDKYANEWIEKWKDENTDPMKFVFEDILIAAFLIELWKLDDSGEFRSKNFVDVGCGNGLLVHILTKEGHVGFGVDIAKRKIWDLFGGETKLVEMVVEPSTASYLQADWIIGNHPDELTFWIPIIAHRSNAKFIILPCCFHDFSGAKYNPSLSPLSLPFPLPEQHHEKIASRYHAYLSHVEVVIKSIGYIPEKETLRIPSTKNVCLVGRSRTDEDLTIINDRIAKILEN
ncbi:hypothetical protein HK096_008976, partial [Nowakowskiella sp. JEL0078]